MKSVTIRKRERVAVLARLEEIAGAPGRKAGARNAIRQVRAAEEDLAEPGRLVVTTSESSEWAVRRAVHDVRNAAPTEVASEGEGMWVIELVTAGIPGLRERQQIELADAEAILADPDGERDRRGLGDVFEIRFTREA